MIDQAIAFPKLPNSVYQSGHAALYTGFQMHQYALRYADAQPAQPDCRTCFHLLMCHLKATSLQCTNGDKYQESPKVVLWRTE